MGKDNIMNKRTNRLVTSAILLIGYSSIYSMEVTIGNNKRVLDLTNLSNEKSTGMITRSKKRSAQQAGLITEDTAPKKIKLSGKKSKISNNKQKEKRFPCEYCDKEFTKEYNLINHTRMHTGEKPFSCEKCERSFQQKAHLVHHMQTHIEKNFSCDQCNKKLATLFSLENHKRIHTGERPFVCDECGESFNQQGNLSKHKLAHMSKKPFSCGKCERSFRYAGELESHINKAHNQINKAHNQKELIKILVAPGAAGTEITKEVLPETEGFFSSLEAEMSVISGERSF